MMKGRDESGSIFALERPKCRATGDCDRAGVPRLPPRRVRPTHPRPLVDEAQVKANFLEGCVEGHQKKSAFCGCAWRELRKSLEVAELLGDDTQPRFLAAKTKMVAACKGQLTYEIPKADFMPACMQEQPEREKPCACVWKKLAAKFSAEELAAGTVDVTSVPGLGACNK